jgi:ubiquinol-cytochrome c reductase cytochrome b subunit
LPTVVITFILGLTAVNGQGAFIDEAGARKLMNSQGCKACHSLEGDGGKTAASFEDIRARSSRAEIRSQLVNPAHRHGNGRIPDFSHLSDAEVDALVDFIQAPQTRSQ